MFEHARQSPLIHCEHGQTHEMRPASGTQGYLMQLLVMLQSLPSFWVNKIALQDYQMTIKIDTWTSLAAFWKHVRSIYYEPESKALK